MLENQWRRVPAVIFQLLYLYEYSGPFNVPVCVRIFGQHFLCGVHYALTKTIPSTSWSLRIHPRKHTVNSTSFPRLLHIDTSTRYLLGSGGTLVFDITIISQSFCYRPRHRRQATSSYVRIPDEEEADLLSHDSLSAHVGDSINILHRGRTARNQTST